MTFYEIVEPPIPSELSNLPIPLLKKAIGILAKTAKAQIIAVADGEGVRFLPGTSGR
jgi:ESCRT-II complex subunit VPS25